jgi:hypothetical protein
MIAGLALALSWNGAPADVSAAEKAAGSVWVRDALTVPGRSVTIEARLFEARLLREAGLGGEQLELFIDSRPVATAMTGGDGRAFFAYTPVMRGNYPIKVKLRTSKRVEGGEGVATLACWERRRPILLVDLATLVEPSTQPSRPFPSLPLELGERSDRAPAPDAAVELKRLTQYYFNVVYLSRTGDLSLEQGDPRAWLRRHGFPTGFWVPLAGGSGALATQIEDMRAAGWDNLKAGIGATREFAEVLIAKRMQAVILPASERDRDLPKKAQEVQSWKDVRTKLVH